MDPNKDESFINTAYEQRQYDQVLSLLLKGDHEFPNGFNQAILSKAESVQKSLIDLDQKRRDLHKHINDNNLRGVKQFITKKKCFRNYYNNEDESAAFAAIKYKKFDIYGYLVSKGANLRESEMTNMNEFLDLMDMRELRDVMLSHFSSSNKSHIYYLISKMKIKSKYSFENSKKKLFGYLEKLNRIESFSIILKVLQYSDSLNLVLDFDNNNVRMVCPTAGNNDRGLTDSILGIIYIAAKRPQIEILGTIAHELTHMAMELVFRNQTNPYYKSDEEGKFSFQGIAGFVEDSAGAIDHPLSAILMGSFGGNYEDDDQEESELIARVSQIIAQDPKDGREWLNRNFPDLLEFYEGNVISECKKFIEQNFILKIKSLNRSMNEHEGEIINLKKCQLYFHNVGNIKNFLNTASKRIFALITRNTWLGLFKILQAIYDRYYVDCYDRFLVLNLENINRRLCDNVTYLFNSEATEILIIECSEVIGDNGFILERIEPIMKVIQKKENKKIIFIMREEENGSFMALLNRHELNEVFVKENDQDISLANLDVYSRARIADGRLLPSYEIDVRENE